MYIVFFVSAVTVTADLERAVRGHTPLYRCALEDSPSCPPLVQALGLGSGGRSNVTWGRSKDPPYPEAPLCQSGKGAWRGEYTLLEDGL